MYCNMHEGIRKRGKIRRTTKGKRVIAVGIGNNCHQSTLVFRNAVFPIKPTLLSYTQYSCCWLGRHRPSRVYTLGNIRSWRCRSEMNRCPWMKCFFRGIGLGQVFAAVLSSRSHLGEFSLPPALVCRRSFPTSSSKLIDSWCI